MQNKNTNIITNNKGTDFPNEDKMELHDDDFCKRR